MNKKIIKGIKFGVHFAFTYVELVYKFILLIVIIHYLSVIFEGNPDKIYVIWMTTIFGLMYISKSVIKNI